ncbi:MAG: hypothetical protein Q8N63_03890 [Nanoarchaeota archaeon]|nr:hypothetical protein [Nanoarchaeota archaeon]
MDYTKDSKGNPIAPRHAYCLGLDSKWRPAPHFYVMVADEKGRLIFPDGTIYNEKNPSGFSDHSIELIENIEDCVKQLDNLIEENTKQAQRLLNNIKPHIKSKQFLESKLEQLAQLEQSPTVTADISSEETPYRDEHGMERP